MQNYAHLMEKLDRSGTDLEVKMALDNLFNYFDSVNGGILKNFNGMYYLNYSIVDYVMGRLGNNYYTPDDVKEFIKARNGAFDLSLMLLTRLVDEEYISLEEALSFRMIPYNLYFLEYLFDDGDPKVVITDELHRVISYLRCASMVSEKKTRELIRLAVEHFGCEEVFDKGCARMNMYNPPWALFLENVIINTCDKPLTEYDVEKLTSPGSKIRFPYLVETRVDNV